MSNVVASTTNVLSHVAPTGPESTATVAWALASQPMIALPPPLTPPKPCPTKPSTMSSGVADATSIVMFSAATTTVPLTTSLVLQPSPDTQVVAKPPRQSLSATKFPGWSTIPTPESLPSSAKPTTNYPVTQPRSSDPPAPKSSKSSTTSTPALPPSSVTPVTNPSTTSWRPSMPSATKFPQSTTTSTTTSNPTTPSRHRGLPHESHLLLAAQSQTPPVTLATSSIIPVSKSITPATHLPTVSGPHASPATTSPAKPRAGAATATANSASKTSPPRRRKWWEPVINTVVGYFNS
jgi:hypothetical protein